MSQDRDQHLDIKGLVEDMRNLKLLNNDELNTLQEALSSELVRRNTLIKGLDHGEKLQFETLIDMIRTRTGLEDADALVMVRAHGPEMPPLRGRDGKSWP